MTTPDRYTVDAAREAADHDRLDEWVRDFLGSPGSDNAELAELLAERVHAWLGPVRLPLDRLHRLAGAEGQPVLCEVDEREWSDRVPDMHDKIEQGWEPPPMIVTWRRGQLVLEDGNHRAEALRRAGTREAWSVVGFEDAEQAARFEAPAADPA